MPPPFCTLSAPDQCRSKKLEGAKAGTEGQADTAIQDIVNLFAAA
jgi:hypothetical protein